MADDTEKRVSVKYILDSSGFNDELKGINQNLKLNKSELKDAEAGVKAFGTSTENLTKVQKALGDTIENQSKKVALYQESITKMQTKMEENIAVRDKLQASLDMEKAKLESSIQAYGKDSEVTQNAKTKVAELTAELDKKNAAVESNAKSINNYTTNLNKADAELKRMQGDLAATNKQIAAQNDTWAGVSKNLENGSKSLKTVSEGANKVGDAFLKVGAPIVAADAVGAKLFMDFDDGMGKIATIADTSSENLVKMGNQVIDLSNKTGQSTDVLQEALYETISSGVQTGDAMNFLSNATKTAVGGFTDANTAVDGLTTVLNAYGLQASDATKISNQMIVAQNLGKTTFGEMAKSIGLVADTTANMNVKTQDLFSSLAVETAHGIDTSEAISGLREALSNIIKPTDDATKQAKSLGLEFNAAHLKSVGWAQFLKEVAEKTHGNTTEMGQLFGSVQGLNTMITLTSESGMSLFNQSLQQMSSNTDYVGQAFDKVQNTAGNKFKNSLNELKNSMIKLGEASEPIINDLSNDLKIVAGALNGMDKSTLQNITTVGLWTVGVGGALKVLAGVGKGISSVLSVSSKVTEIIGKKTLENTLKSNTKAETENTESININTGSKNVNTESQASNTAATNINTAAQEANSKAMSKTVASEGISTAAKEASTVAEGENTAASLANEAAQGKNAKGILGTAKNFIGLGTAAAGAGEAIAGAGTATATAGEATAGAATATGGLVTALGAVALPATIAVGAIAGIGAIAYDLHKNLAQSVVPSVDLFKDKVEKTGTSFVNVNGMMIPVAEKTTTKISEATKNAVGAYMQMDDSVKQSLSSIYANSDTFSNQAKTTVVNKYTDMVNKVKTLDSDMKTSNINDFKALVTNTGVLTDQNKSILVSKYTDMVNKITGLSKKQKDSMIKDFRDTLTQSTALTDQQKNTLVSKYTEMGNSIKSAIDKTNNEQLKTMQDFFSKSKGISEAEQTIDLQDIQKSNNSKKTEIDLYEKQIQDILQKASDEHRGLTQEEYNTINDIQNRMRTSAVNNLSQTETESKVILERLKSYGANVTAEQASEMIKNANKARDGAVAAANDRYNKEVAVIIQQRDQTHKISSDQADKLLKEAARQRDGTISAAETTRNQTVSKITSANSTISSSVNTTTGNILTQWDKVKKYWDGLSFPEKTMKVVTSISKAIGGDPLGGIANLFGYANGTDYATAGVHLVGENGPELISFAGGEKVFDAERTAGILSKLNNNGDNSDSIKYGGNLVAGIAEGMSNKINLLSSVATKAGNTISTGLNKAYTDINTVFKDQLTTSIDVIDNKAIAASDALAKMVMPERNARAQLWVDMAKGTETYDTALNKLQADNDKLGVSTGDAQTDLRNMLGEMTNLSTISVIASNQYTKLGNSIGWTDSKTQEALKTYQNAQKEYLELGQKVVEEQQKISDSVSNSLNDLFSKLKDSLKDKYTEMQKQDEDYWNDQIDNNNKWKENTLKNLETVYNAKKNELDKEKTDLDRSFDDQDDADKEAELRKELSMHLGAEKQKEVQQELNDLIKQRDRRHQKEQLDDQESALDQQYKVDQDNANATAEANEDKYKAQIKIIDDFYTEKLKDANIDAEAQKMIIENNQSDIIKLLKDYGKDYELAGASLGDRFVNSFKDRLSSIQGVINSIIGQVNTIDINSINSTTRLSSSTASTPAVKNSNIMDSLNNAISKIQAKVNSTTTNTPIVVNSNVNVDGKTIAKATGSYINRQQGTNLALEMRGL